MGICSQCRSFAAIGLKVRSRDWKAVFFVLAVVLHGCQARESTTPPPSPSQTSEQTNRPIAQQTSPPGQQTQFLAGRTVEQEMGQGATLLHPEYYPGKGAVISTTATSTAEAPVSNDGRVSLNFANADIREVIDVVLGDTLKLNYIIDPRVQGTVLARTSEPLKREDVIPALENILALNGAALKLEDGLYHVIPLSEASHQLGLPQSPLTTRQRALGFTITIIPLRYTSASAFHDMAASLIPQDRVFLSDPSRNLLIFAGTGTEVGDLLDFVRLFDVNWMSGMSYALFPVEVANVTDLASELEQVFLDERTDQPQDLIRFIPIKRMNSILVISPQQSYLEEAGRWIERLDRGETSRTRRLYVYYVQNSRATDLAEILSQVFGSTNVESRPGLANVIAPGLKPVELSNQTSETLPAITTQSAQSENKAATQPQAQIPKSSRERQRALGGTTSTIGALTSEGENIRVIADERNNALVILATPSEFRMIESALHRLDLIPLQVLLEATIAEVRLTDDLKYGLQWFFTHGDFSATFSDSKLPNGPVISSFPGFSAVFSSDDARVVLNALTAVTDVNVISSPQLMVLDNQSALLNVGDSVPIVVQQSQELTGAVTPVINTVEYRDTGVILQITPHINTSGLVMLEVIQEVSDAIQTESSKIDSPTITVRRVESNVAVQSGETVALGGLIKDTQTKGVTGIPLLSDIPILGNLFKTTSEGKERTELLILITPQVVRNLDDAQAVTKELRQRLTGFEVLERRIGRILPPAPVSQLEGFQNPENPSRPEAAESVNPPERNGTSRLDTSEAKTVKPTEHANSEENPANLGTIDGAEIPSHSVFAIHLSSLRSEKAAKVEWTQLQAKYPELLGDKHLALQTIKLDGRGTFVRVLAEPFKDRAGAQRLCKEFRSTKQYCAVLKQPHIDGLNP